MAVELVTLIFSMRWAHAFLVTVLMIVIALPVTPNRRLIANVPVEIQVFAVAFVFATLFLGEVGDFYEKFWWWDIALHTCSGVLLGLAGFLTLYLLNETETVSVHMRPLFLAIFAFFFSVGLGAIWEIFEFAMDQFFGLTMQKPMLGDPSGLTDTMWDLIVDTLGAFASSLLGLLYMLQARKEGRRDWLQRFVARYPNFFTRT
ncbi:hypothetical protein HT136_12320 [Novosphingobium profundi]|nr:hypothetical protein [Novosphingobium profundi]MBT0669147.1 hypothetical protein [Novosphingobium profundi]